MAQSGKRQGERPEEQLDNLDSPGRVDSLLANLSSQIEAPETDWDSIYIRIKLSPLGHDFDVARFLATPVGLIKWLITKITEYEQGQQNSASHSTAVLNTQLMWAIYGMGGAQGAKPQARYKDFLPFPEVGSAEAQVQSAQAWKETQAALRRALQTGQLPYDIFVELWRGPRA